jgi:hypothetical protein
MQPESCSISIFQDPSRELTSERRGRVGMLFPNPPLFASVAERDPRDDIRYGSGPAQSAHARRFPVQLLSGLSVRDLPVSNAKRTWLGCAYTSGWCPFRRKILINPSLRARPDVNSRTGRGHAVDSLQQFSRSLPNEANHHDRYCGPCSLHSRYRCVGATAAHGLSK